MSVAALPYTLLLLLGQFTAGCAVVLLGVQARGKFEAAFIRTCAWLTVGGGLLLLLTALALDSRAVVDGYQLEVGVSRVLSQPLEHLIEQVRSIMDRHQQGDPRPGRHLERVV